jgi:hypothetical protein
MPRWGNGTLDVERALARLEKNNLLGRDPLATATRPRKWPLVLGPIKKAENWQNPALARHLRTLAYFIRLLHMMRLCRVIS